MDIYALVQLQLWLMINNNLLVVWTCNIDGSSKAETEIGCRDKGIRVILIW